MYKLIQFFCWGLFWGMIHPCFSQVSLPRMEHIYGGTIRQIDTVQVSSTQSVVFVCAESPRALFYGKVDPFATSLSAMFGGWSIVPDFESNFNHGIPSQFCVHQSSGRIFIADENEGLLSCFLSSGSLVTNIPGQFVAAELYGDYLFAVETSNDFSQSLWIGTVDPLGNVSLGSNSIPLDTQGYTTIAVNPSNECVYLMGSMNSGSIYKSSDTYDLFTTSTSFSEIVLPSPLNSWDGEQRIGFGPDGKMFINGQSNMVVLIGVSTNDAVSFDVADTGRESAGTTMGLGFEAVGTVSDYEVYFGMFVNTNCGDCSGWSDLPRGPGGWSETHVNMGAVRVDPINRSILYMTTDQGTGISTNDGVLVYENNYGLTATHISDVDLALTTKDYAWAATKSGAWRTTNFTSTASWLDAGFPDGIGNSVAIDQSDLNYETVYVGSRRLYKTTDAGVSWNRVYTALIQDGNMSGIEDGWVEEIEVFSNMVFAGYHGYDHENPDGLLVWSTNSATDFSVITNHVDVTDLLFTDTTGTNTLLASFAFYTESEPYGIYRFLPESDVFSSVFSNRVHITDLVEGPTGAVYSAAITSNNMPVVYKADADLCGWQLLPTNGLPVITQGPGPSNWMGPSLAVGTNALGHQIIYLSLETSIWFLAHTNTTWQTKPHMQYADGSSIHVMVWDDLLIGTDIGLYAQDVDSDGDGISDRDESNLYSTDPLLADSDDDGLDDLEEVRDYLTDPLNPDSDNDGALDGHEVVAGTNPINASSLFAITQLDHMGSNYIAWSSVEGQVYSVWASSNLMEGFFVLTNNLLANPPENLFVDRSPVAASNLFYRISTE